MANAHECQVARRTSAASVTNRNASSTHSNNTSGGPSSKSPVFSDGVNLNYMRTFQSDPNSPKHISISYASSDHNLIYESVVLFYSLSAFLLQLLHLYRTVWWLPQSYEKNAVVSIPIIVILRIYINSF